MPPQNVAIPQPFDYARPDAPEIPQWLGMSDAMDEIQQRAAIATRGTAGSDPRYRDQVAKDALGQLLQRALLSESGGLGSYSKVLPVEEQYLRQVSGYTGPETAQGLIEFLRGEVPGPDDVLPEPEPQPEPAPQQPVGAGSGPAPIEVGGGEGGDPEGQMGTGFGDPGPIGEMTDDERSVANTISSVLGSELAQMGLAAINPAFGFAARMAEHIADEALAEQEEQQVEAPVEQVEAPVEQVEAPVEQAEAPAGGQSTGGGLADSPASGMPNSISDPAAQSVAEMRSDLGIGTGGSGVGGVGSTGMGHGPGPGGMGPPSIGQQGGGVGSVGGGDGGAGGGGSGSGAGAGSGGGPAGGGHGSAGAGSGDATGAGAGTWDTGGYLDDRDAIPKEHHNITAKEGEFIVKPEVVSKLGRDFFEKLNQIVASSPENKAAVRQTK